MDKADGILKDYTQLHTTQEGAYTQWHRSSGTLARDWGQQRSAMIDDASKMRTFSPYRNPLLIQIIRPVNTTAIKREASLNAFLKGAKLQVKERKEQEEVIAQ